MKAESRLVSWEMLGPLKEVLFIKMKRLFQTAQFLPAEAKDADENKPLLTHSETLYSNGIKIEDKKIEEYKVEWTLLSLHTDFPSRLFFPA